MKTWSAWEITRHQAALCGRVVDAGGNGISGAEVTLVSMPEVLSTRISAADGLRKKGKGDLDNPLCRRVTKANGVYYFLDLPDGRYTVRALDARTNLQALNDTAVSWDKNGKVSMVWLNLQPSEPS